MARPVSLILSVILVILVVLVVVLVVAPELGKTLVSVVKKVEEDIPLAQKWFTDTFQSDSEIVKWAGSIEIDPQKIIDSIISVLKNGADNLVSSTITVTMGLVNMAVNFVSQMDEKYRAPLTLAVLGYRIKEIASLLGMSEANTKVRISRARHMLRAYILQEENQVEQEHDIS